jgi:protein TonB
MDFTPAQPKKNPTGIAVVILLHLGAALVALQNNTIALNRVVPPGVIDVLVPPPVEPPPLPDTVPLPTPSSPPPIAVPPVQDFVPQQPPPALTTRSTTDMPPTVTPSAAGATGSAAVEPAARPAPVRVAAVVDARACKRPDYPRNALRNGETGTVTLALLIGTDGKVVESKVEGSSGSRELDRAAQAGLSLCRFQPGTVDGVAYESWTRMQYVWNLAD